MLRCQSSQNRTKSEKKIVKDEEMVNILKKAYFLSKGALDKTVAMATGDMSKK